MAGHWCIFMRPVLASTLGLAVCCGFFLNQPHGAWQDLFTEHQQMKQWIICRNGLISCGLGEEPGLGQGDVEFGVGGGLRGLYSDLILYDIDG